MQFESMKLSRLILAHLLVSVSGFAEVQPSAIDVDSSAAFRDTRSEPATAETLKGLIAPAPSEIERASWTIEASESERRSRGTYHFRIAFKESQSLGGLTAVLQNPGTVTIRALKPNAPFPGDPAADHWITLPAWNASETIDCVLSPGFKTRSILITDSRPSGQSNLRGLTFRLQRRYVVTGSAIAQGEQTKHGQDPANLIVGDLWRSAGAEPNSNKVNRSPVTTVAPSWASLVWDEPQSVSSIRIRSNAKKFELREFIGEPDVNPALATAAAWRVVDVEPVIRPIWRSRHLLEQVYTFDTPKPISALQFHVTKVTSASRYNSILEIHDFTVFRNLAANEPVPVPVRRTEPPPPLQFTWKTEVDSEPAMVINTPEGRRVRNLFAQVPQKAGDHLAAWDLKDDKGLPVAPGTYHWEAVYGPEPRLIYQMTPYPNSYAHSPHSSPWQGESDDGWMSNHGQLTAVCALGDHVFMGQNGSEGGHALIEVTNSGSKLWGTHETTDTLFTDGNTLFSHNIWQGNISRLNHETKKQELMFSLAQDPSRQGNIVGLAAKDDRIYIAYHAPVPFLEDATGETKISIGDCLPKLRSEITGSSNYGISGRPQWDFMSLFRLTEFVNGSDSNAGLLRIPSTKGIGREQHILLAFKEPTPLGSLIFPGFSAPEGVKMLAYVLKPKGSFPPKVDKLGDWTPVPLGVVGDWNCVALPTQTLTRALRLTFSQPGGELDLLLDGDTLGEPSLNIDLPLGGAKKKKAGGLIASKNEWRAELDGMRILRRRFEKVSQKARIQVNSGTYDEKAGEWDARRDEILSESNPAIFMMEWDELQSIRGLSLKELDGEEARIDVFTGPVGAEIDLSSSRNWEEVAVYNQKLRYLYAPDRRNNSRAIYLDGVVDFGRSYETRAVRLRIVSQWKEQDGRQWGIRLDRGGSEIDWKRCRLYGIAPLRYLGGEPEKSAMGVRRIEVRDGATGQLIEEKPSRVSGELCFDPHGQLHGIVGKSVVRIEDGAVVATGLENPRCLQISKGGEFYVYDHGVENRQVKVFDSSGTLLRSIGKPGRRLAGPYDPDFLEDINEMSLDSEGSLWLVYEHDNPRRIMKFSADGEFLADFFGNTNYGGGGTIDPWDPTRMYFRDMVFKLDHETGESRLAALTSADHLESSDQSSRHIRRQTEVFVLNDRRYVVTAPISHTPEQNVALINLFDEKKMTVRMCAAVGHASRFPPLQNEKFIAKTGGAPLGGYRFLWNDLNQDGEVEVDEVVLTKLESRDFFLGRFDDGLGVMSGNLRFEPERFLDDGTPILKENKLSFSADYRLSNGNYFRYAKGVNEVVTPAGEPIWSYPAHHRMSGLYVPPYQPGKVDLQYGIKGHGRTSPEGLGDFFVIFSNSGQANVWTADGFLATRISYHKNNPRRNNFSSFDHKRGADVSRVTFGQEHFSNYFTQSVQDGRHFVVGGHLTMSLFEVKGLNDFKRIRGTIEVTPELVEKTRIWDTHRIAREQFSKPHLAQSLPGAPEPDGQIDSNEYQAAPLEIEGIADLRISHDENALYLGWRVHALAGPFKNTGTEFQRTFKTGGGVDVKLGLDPTANPNRRQPVVGDARLILTKFNGKPTAILYRPVAPGKPGPWSTETEAGGMTSFDDVKIIRDIKLVHKDEGSGYVLEATIPWQSLGLNKAPNGQRLRFDWSVLSTATGHKTIARRSWANKLAVGTTDEPTEARLTPGLWGWLEIQSQDDNTPDLDNVFDKKKESGDLDSLIDGL